MVKILCYYLNKMSRYFRRNALMFCLKLQGVFLKRLEVFYLSSNMTMFGLSWKTNVLHVRRLLRNDVINVMVL